MMDFKYIAQELLEDEEAPHYNEKCLQVVSEVASGDLIRLMLEHNMVDAMDIIDVFDSKYGDLIRHIKQIESINTQSKNKLEAFKQKVLLIIDHENYESGAEIKDKLRKVIA